MINKVNVSNEILNFKSKQLMAEALERVGANVDYTIKDWLRTEELYTNSPVTVVFPELNIQRVALSVTPHDAMSVKISVPGEKESTVNLNDTLSYSFGRIMVLPNESYNDWIGQTINVTRNNPLTVAKTFVSKLMIRQADADASILNFSLQDYSPIRAKAILDMLFDVYNEDTINENTDNCSSF